MGEQLAFTLPIPAEGLVQLWTPSEIFERLDSGNVEHFVEDRRIERKSVSVQPRTLSEYLSMWSNTQPHGGLIIIGVDDAGRVTGCKSAAISHRNSLESLSTFCPDARYVTRNVPVRNIRGEDDFVLVFLVTYRPDKVVETSAGDAFIREGDKKLRISETVKRELRIVKGEIHYELESVPLKYPEDFDWVEVNKFCKAFFSYRRYKSMKSREELLELAKLGKRVNKQFQPNLACALLFAKDPRDVVPGARIRVIRYDGSVETFGSELNSVFSTFVDGNISKILFAAKPIIDAQLRSFQRYDSSGRLVVQPEYPEEAWFEAVVNAVAHRSYNLRNQNIFVKIFDDRFVVESPGGFVAPTTAATIYDSHNPRNPYLMEAMMHLELTFCGFEGTRRMRSAMRAANLPEPKFRQIEAHAHQVHAILENDIAARRTQTEQRPFERIPEDEFMALSPDERAVVVFLRSSASVNITEASLITGKSWPTSAKLIAGLVEQGILVEATRGRRKHDSTKAYALKQSVSSVLA